MANSNSFFSKLIVWGFLIFWSCSKTSKSIPNTHLFSAMPTEITSVEFKNKIVESEDLYYYKYLYMYIGAGVAAADFNNDGLEDLFFVSNLHQNKIFLNKGDFKFEDITVASGLPKTDGFNTGVTIVDINNDGYLDIYLNRAGWYEDNAKLANQLYINNGDLTFTEEAKLYGIDDANRSIASTFFDYDKDGDLDLYITNAPARFDLSGIILDQKNVQKHPLTKTFKSSDKLYNNDGKGHFKDVSKIAGILPELGFGLNAQIGDLNNDSWPDIYVSNDFVGADFVYINNQDGTFTDNRDHLFKHISYYSMGSDIADINNDGLQDIMVLDMAPEDYFRSKTTMAMTSIEAFNEMVKKDYYYQYMHNTMQLNNGNGTYSDIAHMSGIAKTDWSWSTLFADFDLDGFNDIYVTNGVYRDVANKDIIKDIDAYIKENKNELIGKEILALTQKLPQQKLTNYIYKNNGDLTFENKIGDWINEKESFSNGAIYADLDNDGDLDIVVNNLEDNATILKNNSRELTKHNYLQFTLIGPSKNRQAIGAIVKIEDDNGDIQTRQVNGSRGFLSSVSHKLHFGLKNNKKIEKVIVLWPNGETQYLKDIDVNQEVKVVYNLDNITIAKKKSQSTFFEEIPVPYAHVDSVFNDFSKQLLLPHKLSQTGPAVSKIDINNDALEDIYIGGAGNIPGKLLITQNDNTFKEAYIPDFIKDAKYEDVSATFFDADNDNDMDLYVVSGSYEFDENSELLQDRLYLNNGKGIFKRSYSKLPSLKSSGAVVVASDYDNDGDQDLFVGSRVIPGKYPYAPTSYLLINDKGRFTIKTKELAPGLEKIGMVTSAVWSDIDHDADIDLIVAGEWMGIEIFTNTNGKLIKDDSYKALSSAKGWWNTLLIADVDNDGDKDIIGGNLGLNYKFKATESKPFHVYTNDYDNNGIEDIILAEYYKDVQVPIRGKSCTTEQIPMLEEKFSTYNAFANAGIKDLFGKNLNTALHFTATEFRSGIFINENGHFLFKPFSNEAQISPINSILFDDLNGDLKKDILLAGNNFMPEIETTRSDAGKGVFYKGDSKGIFTYINNTETGFFADKDVRKILLLKTENTKRVFVANNNAKHQLFDLKK
ncbi:VCBS repeat-containing protein [Flavivirga algicola]|uniref:VCBS repeat-containing protein n=1 Tax=Flavivirga algicola TaxID=2729136 RepID=A0ABX1RVN4_9FLAO|nr:VCBS repeat-containing protein [Flavivirga algicola]NMH86748.1 VCBS repeat-containing protein [Flavivirga algicola]